MKRRIANKVVKALGTRESGHKMSTIVKSVIVTRRSNPISTFLYHTALSNHLYVVHGQFTSNEELAT